MLISCTCEERNPRGMAGVSAAILGLAAAGRVLGEPQQKHAPEGVPGLSMHWPHVDTSKSTAFVVDATKAKAELNLQNLMGTNMPSFNPWYPMERDALPLLKAAGMKLWRWPGASLHLSLHLRPCF